MMSCSRIFDGVEPNGGFLPRGRDYSDPIGTMCRAIPPGTPLTPAAITAELYDTRLWSLALINASMSLIIARISLNTTHARRAAE